MNTWQRPSSTPESLHGLLDLSRDLVRPAAAGVEGQVFSVHCDRRFPQLGVWKQLLPQGPAFSSTEHKIHYQTLSYDWNGQGQPASSYLRFPLSDSRWTVIWDQTCKPLVTISRNSRARRASSSIPSGCMGRGMSGAKMFSQQSGMSRPVKATR